MSEQSVESVQKQLECMNLSKNCTGLVFDEGMKKHCCLEDPNHPETPDRITRIWDALKEGGYTERCTRIKSRDITKEEVLYVHSEEHWRLLSELSLKDSLEDIATQFDSIYLHKETFSTSTLAAGCVVELTEAVVTGKISNGIAVTRPPGHHAERNCPQGFCIFNHVPIAVKHVQKKFNVKKVLIVDWDVHHGNGIQNMFYEDPSVLYFSIHCYQNGFFYPGKPDANFTYVGRGRGEGYNINVAWNQFSKGDDDYMATFHKLLMPVAYEFNPDLVMVASGLDAARGDPIGNCCITPTGYAHMTHLLKSLANGRVVVVLEGGYNLTSISSSMCAIAGSLLGDPLPRWEDTGVPSSGALDSINNGINTHSKYWRCLTSVNVGLAPKEDPKSHSLKEKVEDGASGSAALVKPLVGATGGGGGGKELAEMDRKIMEDNEKFGAVYSSLADSQAVVDSHLTNKDRAVISNLESEGHTTMHAVYPRAYCDHTTAGLKPLPPEGLNAKAPCMECGNVGENWVCLSCYEVHCSRYVKEHMVDHYRQTHHPLVLSYADLSIWCYCCDDYIYNADFMEHLQAATEAKFGSSH